MNILFNNKPEQHGIILDGAIIVGSFKMMTARDSYGNRDIFEVKINSEYFIAEKSKSRNLLFKSVKELGDDKYLQIEDYGYGCIKPMTAAWVGPKIVNIDMASWMEK